MNTTLTPMITSHGLQAVFNAQSTGLQATIAEIALGDGGWTPDDTATALQNEKRRIAVRGERVNESQIHLTGVEDGTDLEYWVREIGFYLADGTLLAIWSDADQALAYKSTGVDLLLSFDLVLSALPAQSVTVDGSAGFSLPPATESKRGIIRIATQAELVARTATDVAINPAQLAAALAIDDSTLMSRILKRDGKNSGLDADLLRGLPADFSSLQSENGYQKLPSGLILQWGHPNLVSGSIVHFPIAFPKACFAVFITEDEKGIATGATKLTQTGYKVLVGRDGSSNFYWMAIGY